MCLIGISYASHYFYLIDRVITMKSITDKIALQHLINSYLQETGNGHLIPVAEQCKHPANTALPSDPISLNLVPT